MSAALAQVRNLSTGDEGAITHSVCSSRFTQNAAPSRTEGANAQDGPLSQQDLWALNTGWEQSPEEWRDRSQRQERLRDQTTRMADALEAEGIRTRLDQGDVVDLSEVTGQVDRSEAFRSICFLPLIAQRERRQVLNRLRYFQKNDPRGRHMRYAVITSGERIAIHEPVHFADGAYCPVTFTGGRRRVRVVEGMDGPYCPLGSPAAPSCPIDWEPWRAVPADGPLRARTKELHRRVSKWAFEAHRRFGIEVFCRVTEYPTDETFTVHPHANVIYAPSKMLPAHQWRAFLSWSRSYLGAHWHDAGKLEKPDEVLKYPFKPEDVDEMDGPCLAWLYRETTRLKMVQPMASFAELSRELDEADQKIAMVNRQGGARLERIRKSKREPADPEAEAAPDDRNENRVLCRTSPQFRHCPYAEPVTRVLNYTEDPQTATGRERLAEIRERQAEARAWWDANGAPDPATALSVGRGQAAAADGAAGGVTAFRVHTCRPTVQAGSGEGTASPPPAARVGPGNPLSGPGVAPDGTRYNPETGEIIEPAQPGMEVV